jgi:hypothetical protein
LLPLSPKSGLHGTAGSSAIKISAKGDDVSLAAAGDALSERSADVDRFWLDTMEDTISIVRAVFADHALFLLLCGAVFALQQDMLKAHGIGVRKVRTSREQARSTLNKLYDIDDVNFDLLQEPVQIRQTYRAHSISARMRSIAARIWLLTNYASVAGSFGTKPSSATILNLGVGNLWMMLGTVGADELRENANFFTGTYFSGVRSKSMHLKHWPHRPEVAV